MLHSLAILPLAAAMASSAPNTADVNLAAALPADTIAAIHFTDPRALIASRETNNWVSFALDAQWDRYLAGVLQSLGDDILAEEVPAWRNAIIGAMANSTGAMFFVAGDANDAGTDPALGLLVKGGNEAGTLLRRFIADDAKEEPIGGGRNVLMSDRGRAELFYEQDGVILVLSALSQEKSKAIASNVLDAMSGAAPGGPLGIPGVAKLRRPGAAFEAALNLEPFWQLARNEAGEMDAFEARVLKDASDTGWMYVSGELGIGEAADWNIFLPYGQTGLVGDLLGFFGTADKSLLANAPDSAISATVGAFDMSGFSTWVFDVMEEASEEAYTEATGAMEMVKTTMGIDVMNDVLGNMTGQFLGFSNPADEESIRELTAMMGSNPTTLVVGVEDSDPILDIVEQLVDMSGMGSELDELSQELGDDSSIEMWRAGDGLPFAGFIGVGDGKIILSTDPSGGDAYISRLGGTDGVGSILDDEKMAAAVKPLNGAIVSIQPTAGAAAVFEGIGAMLDAFDVDALIPDQDEDEDVVAEAEFVDDMKTNADVFRGVADLFRQYFEGTTTTEMSMEGGLVRITTISR